MTTQRILLTFAFLATASALTGCSRHQPADDSGLRGAEPESSALHAEVVRLDDRLSAAFNAHDLDRLMALFSPDLEFYHDADGLQSFAESKAGFGGLFAQNNGIKRQLVGGTLRVFPIAKYGALELGAHRFCHDENGKNVCGTFQFVHVWRQQGADWKIARVISYGH